MSYLATARRALAARHSVSTEHRKESEESEVSPPFPRLTRFPSQGVSQVRTSHRAYAFRVVVDAMEPVTGRTIELRQGVRVIDTPRVIETLLADLGLVVQQYGEVCADGGDDQRLRLAREYGELVEQLVENLAKLGVRVRVVAAVTAQQGGSL